MVLNYFHCILFICLLNKLWCHAFNLSANLNLHSRQFINEVSNTQIARFQSPVGKPFEKLKILNYGSNDDNFILVGGRDAFYNLSLQTLENQNTIDWKAPSQTVEECLMKGKFESECHNFLQIVVPLQNGLMLVCGTHAFSPQCREYKFLSRDNRFIKQEQYSGQAISPYDPNHNSTFVYNRLQNQIYVGTVSDISSDDALLYRRQITFPTQDESLRTPNDDRVLDNPNFVGSFIHKEYVYFWFRERAIESLDNNREQQIYARVGRVCINDNGSSTSASEKFSTFLKARLNCSMPSKNNDNYDSTPFYFNELQAISNLVEDKNGDTLVFGVFHTSKSLLLSAVCAFRISQINAIFDHGRFKTQKTPTSLWSLYQKFYSASERPGRCVYDNQRQQDVSFITKNPLMYDLVPSEGHHPLLIEGPDKPPIISISAHKKRVNSVRKQLHYTVYIGRTDGTIAKLVETSVNKASVLVENVQVLNSNDPIITIKVFETLSNNALIAASTDKLVRLPLHHCYYQTNCMLCVRLRDPHCAWDIDKLRCVNEIDWSRGSFIQNIIQGVSEQCPDYLLHSGDNSVAPSYSIKSSFLAAFGNKQNHLIGNNFSDNTRVISNAYSDKFFYSTKNLSIIAIIVAVSSMLGFLIGYRISKWRMLSYLTNRPTGSRASSNGSSVSNQFDLNEHSNTGKAKNNRHDSLITSAILMGKGSGFPFYNENVYAPHGGKMSISSEAADAVSLLFNSGGSVAQQHFVQLHSSVSNGGSGMATPRHDARQAILLPGGNGSGSTLPRDYKVKKVYL